MNLKDIAERAVSISQNRMALKSFMEKEGTMKQSVLCIAREITKQYPEIMSDIGK